MSLLSYNTCNREVSPCVACGKNTIWVVAYCVDEDAARWVEYVACIECEEKGRILKMLDADYSGRREVINV